MTRQPRSERATIVCRRLRGLPRRKHMPPGPRPAPP